MSSDLTGADKKNPNPRLFLGETWSAFKTEQVCFSVAVCNLSRAKLQFKSSPKATAARLFQNCQSRTPHRCQYSFIPPLVKISTISQHHLIRSE